MENIQVASWIVWLSSMIGAVTAILAAVLSVSKKARGAVRKLVRKDVGADEIKVELNGINTELISLREAVARIEQENGRQRDAHLAELRNSITGIYYKHLDDKKLAAYEKEDLLKMYDVYAKWNGNSYVHAIVQEMTHWDVEA
jgi:hypothetical protein